MSGPLDPEFSSVSDQQGDVIAVNSNGSISNAPVDGTKNTYSVGSQGIVPATLATDIFTISGSTTKIIRVLKVEITGTQKTDSQILFILLKHFAANSGGTSTNYSNLIVSHDSTNPFPTATVLAYSANPTLGSPNQNVRTTIAYIPATSTAAAGSRIVWDFGNRPGQAIVLRGPNEVLAINLNATTITTGALYVNIEWTEE